MKNSKRNKINLLFSSFLVIGYIICTYFFGSLAVQVGGLVGNLIQVLVLVLFGLLLFYATRVGEGVQVRRFSLAVLLLVDLPALYIILATYIEALPFHAQLSSPTMLPVVFILACVALGYGIPYTFISGYELALEDEAEEEIAQEPVEEPLEGGLAEELAEIAAEEADADTADATADEIAEEISEQASPATEE